MELILLGLLIGRVKLERRFNGGFGWWWIKSMRISERGIFNKECVFYDKFFCLFIISFIIINNIK
jgi:hypothetical protein